MNVSIERKVNKMKLKKSVEIIIIIITSLMFMRMFMVEEMIGCLYLMGIMFNICILSTYGTLQDKINTKLEEFNRR